MTNQTKNDHWPAAKTDFSVEIQRGAALLDQHNPDWWKKIDLRSLDMRSHYDCIMGQLYVNYYLGLDRFALLGSGYYFGFISEDDSKEAFLALENQWIDLINQRRGADHAD